MPCGKLCSILRSSVILTWEKIFYLETTRWAVIWESWTCTMLSTCSFLILSRHPVRWMAQLVHYPVPWASPVLDWPLDNKESFSPSLIPLDNCQLLCLYFQLGMILRLAISWKSNMKFTQKQNRQLARQLFHFQKFDIKFKCYSRFTAIQIKLTFRKKISILP
jgi:hypothetical protein